MNVNTSFCVTIVVVILSLIGFCISAPTPNSDVRPDSYVTLKCRQKCFSQFLNEFKFNGNIMQYLRCKNTPNCYMCWDYCRAVGVAQVDLARSMCSDKRICFKGCKVACRFHRIKTIYDIINEMSNEA